MKELKKITPRKVYKPGDTIKELLDTYKMTQKELAQRMGLTPKTIGNIISGKVPLTNEYAIQLEKILGLPTEFWNTSEATYRAFLAYEKEEENLDSEMEIAKKLPLGNLREMGFMEKGERVTKDVVKKLQRLFRISSLSLITQSLSSKSAFRITDDRDDYALATWIRIGEIHFQKEVEMNDFPKYSEIKLEKSLQSLRDFNLEENANSFIPAVKDILKESGVFFNVVPSMKNSGVTGMARWYSYGKRKIPFVQLSLRGKAHDKFWFTLFHELGHILLHENDLFIDDENDEKIKTQKNRIESEADEFAKNILINQESYKKFLESGRYDEMDIINFSREQNVHPGIVLGRLQFENHVPYKNYLNRKLKKTYRWSYEK